MVLNATLLRSRKVEKFVFFLIEERAEGRVKAHPLLEIHEMFQRGGCVVMSLYAARTTLQVQQHTFSFFVMSEYGFERIGFILSKNRNTFQKDLWFNSDFFFFLIPLSNLAPPVQVNS